jgi:CheY-like chemotaxis protein
MDARKKPGHQAKIRSEPDSRITRLQREIEQKHYEQMNARFKEETYFAPAGRSGLEDLEKQAQETLANPVIRVFLETVQGYLFVLNEHRQILTANPELLKALGDEDPNWWMGLRPGESLNCASFTEGPDGCGTGIKCRSCGAVLAILACQEKDASSSGECSMSMQRGGSTETRDFQVRSTPLQYGNRHLVIFSVLDISQAKRREIMEEVFLHDLLNSLASMEGLGSFPGPIDPQQIFRQYQSFTNYLKEEIRYHRSLKEAENGNLEQANSFFSASEILTELKEILKYHPHASQRHIYYRNGSEGRYCLDKLLLLRVLLNMALNAVEASSADDLVTITYENEGTFGLFSVHNAASMPKEIAAHIFERSFSTKGGPGHGLGTYSMKLLGEKALGGTVSFTTSPEAGTVFSIQLPFERGSMAAPKNAMPETASNTAPPVAHPSPGSLGRPRHILFIDDMEPLARLGKLFLEREGFEVTAKTDALEAIALFQRAPDRFGLVITDLTMPKLNGLELARRINKLAPEMPILLCTGYQETFPVAELKTAGIRDIIFKPFISSELGRVVQKIRTILET